MTKSEGQVPEPNGPEPDRPVAPTAVDPDRQFGDIGSRVVYEDDRVRVWFLKLQPGEKSAVHKHDLDHLLIQIAGDRVAVIPEPDTRGAYSDYYEADVIPGRVNAMPSGGIETAFNAGSERYHEVIVELKQPTTQSSSESEAAS